MNIEPEPVVPTDGPVRFSTQWLPPADRLGIWREEFGRQFVRLEMAPLEDEPLHYDATFRFLGDMSVGDGTISAISCARTRPLLADGNDDIVLLVPLDGALRAEQGRIDAVLNPGDCLVRRSSEVGRTRSRAGRFLTLTLPASSLADRVADIDRLLLTVLRADTGTLHLLAGYCRMVLDQDRPITADTGTVVREHLLDLAALAIGANREAWHIARDRGLRACRRHMAQAAIRHNATRTGYRVSDLAQAMHVSESYVRKLLAEGGQSFTALLLEARLDRARQRLADPRYRDWQIAQIAFDSGFGDISYFNRRFNRRFGMTPSRARLRN